MAAPGPLARAPLSALYHLHQRNVQCVTVRFSTTFNVQRSRRSPLQTYAMLGSRLGKLDLLWRIDINSMRWMHWPSHTLTSCESLVPCTNAYPWVEHACQNLEGGILID